MRDLTGLARQICVCVCQAWQVDVHIQHPCLYLIFIKLSCLFEHLQVYMATEKSSMTLMAGCDFPKSPCKNKWSFHWTSFGANELSAKQRNIFFAFIGNSMKWGNKLAGKETMRKICLSTLCNVNKNKNGNSTAEQLSQQSLVGLMVGLHLNSV